jgi:uncharacterized protein DUF6263
MCEWEIRRGRSGRPAPRLIDGQYLVLSARYSALITFLLWMTLPSALHAQTPLRWRLKSGEALSVETRQQTDSHVAFGAKSATTKIDINLGLIWTVVAADDEASTIKQSIQRVVVDLVAPESPPIQYDSSSTARLTGQAARLADGLKPLIGADVEMVMTSRGEIVSVKPANKAAEWMFEMNKGDPADSTFVGRRDLSAVLRRPLVVFPEKAIEEGETWERRDSLHAGSWQFQQVWSYRRSGTVDREGKTLVRIDASSKIDPTYRPLAVGAQPREAKIAVKSHEQTGVILFSPEDGRVIDAEQTQKLVTESPYRETTIVVTLTSTQKTTIKPNEKQ